MKEIRKKIKKTTLTVLCLNVETCEPFNTTINFIGKKSDKEIDKLIHQNDTQEKKAVSVVSAEENELTYSISLDDFIKYAKVENENVEENDK